MASRALAIGATATTAALTAYVASEEGAQRSCVFWANAFPGVRALSRGASATSRLRSRGRPALDRDGAER